MRKSIGHFEGTGKLHREGEIPLQASYILDEYQDVIPAGSHSDPQSTVAGLKSVEGRILCGSVLFPALSAGGSYVLELKER